MIDALIEIWAVKMATYRLD